MDQFNYYEVTAILFPGVLLVAGAGLVGGWVTVSELLDLSFGGASIALVVSYAVGALLHGLGATLAGGYYRLGRGVPSHWPRYDADCFLTSSQKEALRQAAQNEGVDLRSNKGDGGWRGFVNHCNFVVRSRGRPDRLNRFLANYALGRGLATAALVLAVVHVLLPGDANQGVLIGGGAVFFLAGAFMRRHDVNYATELFVQYLGLSKQEPNLDWGPA